MNEKLIFLDFDGVVTTAKSHWQFDEEKMALLGRIIAATDAKIVVTSSWRRYSLQDTIHFITTAEEKRGCPPFAFADKVVGITDRLHASSFGKDDRAFKVVRGEEVRKWQEDNDAWHCPYVILDDDTDMLLWQKDNFIRTDAETGLSEADVEQAIKILNSAEDTGK